MPPPVADNTPFAVTLSPAPTLTPPSCVAEAIGISEINPLSFSNWLVLSGITVVLGNAPTSAALNTTAPVLPLTESTLPPTSIAFSYTHLTLPTT